MDLGTMSVKFGADVSGLTAGIGSAKNAISGLSSLGAPGIVAAGIIGIGAAAVGVGIAATKMAGDYQQGMNKVQALTGANTQEMAQYDSGLKQLAVDAGVAPTQLTDGLYNVMSAGFKGAQAMQVLTLSAEDAKIGMTDQATTSNALTTVLKAFSVQAGDVNRVNGEMLETVTLGKMTMTDYAGSIGKASSVAMQYHVSMEDMNASIATMTSNGIPSAHQAVTDFTQAITVMDGNIGTVSKSLNKSGIAFNEAKFNTLDYQGKISMLNTALETAANEHIKVTGVTKQAAAAIQIISQHSQEFSTDLGTLSDKQAMAAKTQQAWAITQGGFNQTMDRLHATLDVLMISIGQKLLPAVTNIANAAIPVIERFGAWLMEGNRLQNGINAVVGAVTFLGNAIVAIVSAGASIIGFFQNNQIALDALEAVLAAVAIVAIGFAVAAIPALVAGFIAWAVAAGAAAIATIAATWPILAIGAVIAAVVFGIILAVQHWGEISKWLQGVWSAFSSWFMSALGAIGGFFTGLWNGIKSATSAAWNGLVTLVKAAAQSLLDGITAPFRAIGDLFVWLYDHNTYFQKLVDSIKAIITDVVSWLTNTWNSIIQWIVVQWILLKTKAEIAFELIYATIQQKIQLVQNFISGVWSAIVGFLSGIWNKIASNTAQGWSTISGIFGGAWNTYIAGPLGNLWNQFSSWFGNLAGQALSWGKNLIQGFINGITSMLGAVGNTASNVMNTVKSFLGFHSPAEQGPGAELDVWGPNLVKGFSQGIVKSIPQLQSAVNLLVAPVAKIAPNAYPSSGGASSTLSLSANGTANGGNQQIIIYLDSTVLAQAVSSKQAQLVQIKTGIRQW